MEMLVHSLGTACIGCHPYGSVAYNPSTRCSCSLWRNQGGLGLHWHFCNGFQSIWKLVSSWVRHGQSLPMVGPNALQILCGCKTISMDHNWHKYSPNVLGPEGSHTATHHLPDTFHPTHTCILWWTLMRIPHGYAPDKESICLHWYLMDGTYQLDTCCTLSHCLSNQQRIRRVCQVRTLLV